jgi:hypothetical protein
MREMIDDLVRIDDVEEVQEVEIALCKGVTSRDFHIYAQFPEGSGRSLDLNGVSSRGAVEVAPTMHENLHRDPARSSRRPAMRLFVARAARKY